MPGHSPERKKGKRERKKGGGQPGHPPKERKEKDKGGKEGGSQDTPPKERRGQPVPQKERKKGGVGCQVPPERQQ